MTEEGKLSHDSAYPLSRIKTNVFLIRDKYNKEGIASEELNRRLVIIEEQNDELRKYIDEFYKLCKKLRK